MDIKILSISQEDITLEEVNFGHGSIPIEKEKAADWHKSYHCQSEERSKQEPRYWHNEDRNGNTRDERKKERSELGNSA